MTAPTSTDPTSRRQLVQTTTERLRERIFAAPPGDQLGSLPDLARELGVGVVTVQQAARVLEHEGLLDVRRGPGGGYFGRRPDAAGLERTLAAYMRSEPASWEEALDMTSLLFIELCGAATRCENRELLDELRLFAREAAECDTVNRLGELEERFQELLFRMVNRPLFELLTRVTLRVAQGHADGPRAGGAFGVEVWVSGRRRIIDAILRHDEELARFEANRSNRRVLQAWLHRPLDARG